MIKTLILNNQIIWFDFHNYEIHRPLQCSLEAFYSNEEYVKLENEIMEKFICDKRHSYFDMSLGYFSY